MPFEVYITQNNKKLRLGYTTGTCVAIGAKTAAEMLFSNKIIEENSIVTKKGLEVEVVILFPEITTDYASCCVIKDGGDDIDATTGMKIFTKVRKIESGIEFVAGEGIGVVTQKGLDQPVGNAAINSGPRQAITEAVMEVAKKHNYNGGFEITVWAPEGVEIAKRTFNGRLGIVGGISILGTTGIVEPKSLAALSKTIKVEMSVLKEKGVENIIATPGNYGEAFIKTVSGIENFPKIMCSNFIKDTIDYAIEYKFKKMLFIGHGGKFVKIAGGITNTHSQFGDCRMEIIAAHTALFSQKPVKEIMDCVTIDGAVEILDKYGLREKVFNSIVNKVEQHLERMSMDIVETGAIIYSNSYGLLAVGENGKKLLEQFGGRFL